MTPAISYPLFGNTMTLKAAAEHLSTLATGAKQSLPQDAHPTARVAWKYFSSGAAFTIVGLIAWPFAYGAVCLFLLERRVSRVAVGIIPHVVVSIGGGFLLLKLFERLDPAVMRLLGPVPDYRPYNVMQGVNLNESEFYSVPLYVDPQIRRMNELRNQSSSPLKSAFEERVDQLEEYGGETDKKYHGDISRFVVQARCQIAMNFVRDLMLGPEPTLLDEKQRLKRVQERAKIALEAAEKYNSDGLSKLEQKVLQLWINNVPFLKSLNFKIQQNFITQRRREDMPAHNLTAINLSNVKNAEDAKNLLLEQEKYQEEFTQWHKGEDPKTLEGLESMRELRKKCLDDSFANGYVWIQSVNALTRG